MYRRRKGALLALLSVVLVALAAAGCGGNGGGGGGGGGGGAQSQPGAGKPTVTIGTKDFTEEFVLGQLYKQALEAKGYKVNLKSNIGATEITDKALTSGKIDAYPEYTGETVATVFGKNLSTPTEAQETKLATQLYAKRGQVASKPTPFEDVDAIGVLKSF